MSQARLEFTVASEADRGARAYQEDSFQVWRPNGSAKNLSNPVLAVLADGMGGHVAGEKASQIAIARYVENFSSGQGTVEQLLEHSLVASNDGISSEIRKSPSLNGMGCTLVAVYVDQEGLRWASVGDSSVLIYRGQNGQRSSLLRLNEDHSLGALLDKQAEANIITFEEAKNDPRRRTLRSALTGGPIAVQDIESSPMRLFHGDWVLIASDGLETLAGDEIAGIIGRHREFGEPANVVRDLIAEIKKKAAPHQDNVSIVAIKVVDPHDAETRLLAPSNGVKSAADTVRVTAPPPRLDRPDSSGAKPTEAAAPDDLGSGGSLKVITVVVALVVLALAFILMPRLTGGGGGKTDNGPVNTGSNNRAPGEKSWSTSVKEKGQTGDGVSQPNSKIQSAEQAPQTFQFKRSQQKTPLKSPAIDPARDQSGTAHTIPEARQ